MTDTHIHDHSLFCLGSDSDTSITSGVIKLIVWAHTSPFSEMMQSCKSFQLGYLFQNKVFTPNTRWQSSDRIQKSNN
jgi:hypothetical protein